VRRAGPGKLDDDMHSLGIAVRIDNFEDPADLYLLTHFHRDHMTGLARGWSRGPMLCSPITANLLVELEGLPRRNLIPIEPDETRELTAAGRKLTITALEANHCPGALMFVLESGGRKIIHTGDFRLDDGIRTRRHLLAGADRLYVDSTYAAPQFTFPTQEESLATIIDTIRRNMDKEILIGLYTIGKTKIIKAIYSEFGRPVFVTKDKLRAYRAMGYGDYVTDDRREAGFIGYSRAYFDRYFRWSNARNPSNALVIYPSGVCLNARPRPGFFYVPYSEHCDWREYCEFIEMTAAREVVQLDTPLPGSD